MTNDGQRLREFYENISGSTVIAAATTTPTPVAAKANESIFLQGYHIAVTGASNAKTWTVADTTGTPVPVSSALDAGTVGEHEADFGATGVQLTVGKGLQLIISAAGAAGVFSWWGYRKITNTAAA